MSPSAGGLAWEFEGEDPKDDSGLPPLDHTVRDLPKNPAGLNKRQQFELGERRRAEFLNALAHGLDREAALKHVDMTWDGVRNWRAADKRWAKRADDLEARQGSREAPKPTYTFEDFRRLFFNRDTPEFQKVVVDAYEHTPAGNILMILLPPEHGKTTLFEDYASYQLAVNPEYRIIVGSGTQNLGKKVVSRVRNRMEESGPFPRYVRQFGPFAPQEATGRKARQPWSDTAFNVFKKRSHDERDYSLAAIGFKGDIVGARCDHLHCDDLQSLLSINQTPQMVEKFQQDWLTRPGETGKTTVNGTRVGDDDFYETVIDLYEDMDFFRLILMPAYVERDGQTVPLWPRDDRRKSGYTPRMLERMRQKVGEEAWARNYMQKPRAKTFGTFTEDMIDRCKDFSRKRGEVAVPGAPFYIGLDPALGGVNCLVLCQVTPECIHVIDIREDAKLSRNEQIMARLETMVRYVRDALGGHVTDVVIESKNFQLGLARDERLVEMSEGFGFALREHLTGINKYDADIGVPSMATTFSKQQVSLPYGDDEATRMMTDSFRNQLLKWRPMVTGAKLRQDQVMGLWFPWILWNTRRRAALTDTSSFRYGGMPYKKTHTGLMVPYQGSPFARRR